jgi:uncharacterized tellurite resistance protein B-like protein
MRNTLQSFLTRFFASNETSPSLDDAQALQLATAVLLVEVMRCDTDLAPAERAAAEKSLRSQFAVGDAQLARLLAQAEHTSQGANDYFRFTSAMNEQFSQPQKVEVVEGMWRVAYADGRLDENEQHLISKIAGLLHVTHGEYIAAKMRAKEASV